MLSNSLIAFLNTKVVFSKRESDEIIAAIAAEMELGSDFISVLDDLANQDYKNDKKVSSLLKEIKNMVANSATPLEDILLMYGLIERKEHILIKHSSNLVFAMLNILELRENGKTFNPWLSKFIATPFLIVLAGLVLQIPLAAYFMDMFYNDIFPAIQNKKAGEAITPSFPFFLENLIWTKIFLFLYLSLAISLFLGYVYSLKYKVELVYKYLATKFYDDFYYYFRVMDIMKKAQPDLTTDAIFIEMGEHGESDSIRFFFKKMGEKAENFYEDFREIHAPEGVSMKIKRGEQYNTLWDTMNYEEDGLRKGFVWYLQKKRDNKIKLISTWLSKPTVMLSYMLVLAYISITIGSFIIAIVGVM
ncbi:MAG: hypothetical protein PHE67_02255 [Campylobacterales bacterium]|jgi:hypothetical protein|nr:hypothetical protein [Campylobacterales bacterium]